MHKKDKNSVHYTYCCPPVRNAEFALMENWAHPSSMVVIHSEIPLPRLLKQSYISFYTPGGCNFKETTNSEGGGKELEAAYFILRGTVLSVKPWREVEKGGALDEVDVGDYNFSCATMIHRVRGSGNTIRSYLNQAVATPHECLPDTRKRTGSTSCQKNKKMEILFIRCKETKEVRQGYIPITKT